MSETMDLLKIKDLSEEEKTKYYRIKNDWERSRQLTSQILYDRLKSIAHLEQMQHRKWTLYFQDSIIRFMRHANPKFIVWPEVK